jgi:hypothetical protein
MDLPELGIHKEHLRSFYTGVRNGTITGVGTGANQISQADFLHVTADMILAIALTMPWTYEEVPPPSP